MIIDNLITIEVFSLPWFFWLPVDHLYFKA